MKSQKKIKFINYLKLKKKPVKKPRTEFKIWKKLKDGKIKNNSQIGKNL
jgi:hypothetical protein